MQIEQGVLTVGICLLEVSLLSVLVLQLLPSSDLTVVAASSQELSRRLVVLPGLVALRRLVVVSHFTGIVSPGSGNDVASSGVGKQSNANVLSLLQGWKRPQPILPAGPKDFSHS